MKKNPIKLLPHAFTLGSLFLGFSSIIASLQSVKELLLVIDERGEPNPQLYLGYAGIFIIFGCVLDSCDGFFARLLKTSSEIGKQLDSLADLVTFGIAPGVLFYTVTLYAGEYIKDSGIVYRVANIIPPFFLNNIFFIKVFAFIFPICAVIRLARFNNAPPAKFFSGLPSTFAGGAAALALSFNFYLTPSAGLASCIGITEPNIITRALNSVFSNFLILILIFLILGLLMVSPINFYKIYYFINCIPKKIKFPFFLFYVIIAVLFFKYLLLVTAVFYFIFSIIRFFYFKLYPHKTFYG